MRPYYKITFACEWGIYILYGQVLIKRDLDLVSGEIMLYCKLCYMILLWLFLYDHIYKVLLGVQLYWMHTILSHNTETF